MAKDLDPRVVELEELLAKAKIKQHFFALSKNKDGEIVLKASPKLKTDMMIKQCKAEGGQPAFMVSGTLSVSGRVFVFASDSPDVPKSLPLTLKQHFQAIKMKAKAEFVLPGGATIGDEGGESEGHEGEGTEAPGGTAVPQPGTEAPVQGQSPDQSGLARQIQALTERARKVAPQVKALSEQDPEAAENLVRYLQAAMNDLKNGSVERAPKLLDALERAVSLSRPKPQPQSQPSQTGVERGNDGQTAEVEQEEAEGEVKSPIPTPPQTPPSEAETLKNRILSEFDKLKADIKSLATRADESTGKKLATSVKVFNETVGTDAKKAVQILSALKSFLSTELGKLVEKVDEKVDSLAVAMRERRDSLRPADDKKDLATLMALGMGWDEADRLLSDKEDDEEVVEKVLKTRMDAAGVPEDRRQVLLNSAKDNPKAFAAAIDALSQMDKDGAVRISPDAMQDTREKDEKARQAVEKAEKALADAEKKLADSLKAIGTASDGEKAARARADKAADDLKVFQARMGDTSKLSNEAKLKLAEDARKLMNAQETAKAELEKAIEAHKKSTMDYAADSEARTEAEGKLDSRKGEAEVARKANEKKEGKKALLDALAFGPLAPGKTRLKDEDKAAFIAAFGKDPVVAEQAMAIAENAPNPSAVAKHVASVAGKADDGFADKDGNRLDLPIDKRREMAANALRMGGMVGEDYFTGFDEYLKSGKQLEPDPFGSLDKPLDDPKAEALRKKDIAVKRSSAMGQAAIGKDGKVDFSSDAAKEAFDQMMFHPGSLTMATPMVNAKIAETRKLFEDPATKAQAEAVIDRTKLPGPKDRGRHAARDLVARTLGKSPDDLTDDDVKGSVLSAMMTPMSQGPVGSCFATAPVRNIREMDPVRAMDEYSRIATTGIFTDAEGNKYPANRRAPQGENPLMRSLEYSVATAVQQKEGSARRKPLTDGLLSGKKPHRGLDKIKDIPGLEDKWADGKVRDPLTGVLPKGIKSKLRKAFASEFTFEYNAGLDAKKEGAGGDGHSTNGVYQIFYKKKALDTEARFKAAIQEIALAASGETKDSETGKAIIELVNDPAFIKQAKDAYSKPINPPDPEAEARRRTPWNLEGGGSEVATAKALNGGTPGYTDVMPGSGEPKPTQVQRTKDLLKGILTAQSSMNGEMAPIGTSGPGANHAFNTFPNHPSLDKLKGGNIDDRIRTELVEPGQKIASTKLPVEQGAKLFDDQIKAAMKGVTPAERDLLVEALKKRPKTELTPAEVHAAIEAAMEPWRNLAADLDLQAQVEKENAERLAGGKALLTQVQIDNARVRYRANKKSDMAAELDGALLNNIDGPEVLVADTNWGDSKSQTFFVMRPDPKTGDLTMYKKDSVTGKLTSVGRNWVDANWDTVQ